MLDYQELLKDREKLAAQLDRQARLLAEMENSTAIRLATRLQPLKKFLQKLRGLGRLPVAPVAETLAYPALPASERPALILLLHEAGADDNSRLGLALAQHFAATHQVIVVLAAGGKTLAQFRNNAAQVIGPLGFSVHEPAVARRVAAGLAASFRPVFSLAIGADTRYLAAPLAQQGVPVVAVISEFAATVVPYGSLLDLFFWASDLVFPAAIIRESYLADYTMLGAKRTHLLPVKSPLQGERATSLRPQVLGAVGEGQRLEFVSDGQPARGEAAPHPASDAKATEADLSPWRGSNAHTSQPFTVAGHGSVEWRQGVDLFVATAQACRRQSPHTPWRFIWRGAGYRLGHGNDLSTYLSEQIERAGLRDIVSISPTPSSRDPGSRPGAGPFAGPMLGASIGPVAKPRDDENSCDLFLLSARLAALPHAALQAMADGVPVIAFAQASALAEIMQADPVLREAVVPYLDVAAAAAIICRLAQDATARTVQAQAAQRLAMALPGPGDYGAVLLALGRAAAADMQPDPQRRDLLEQPGNFDSGLYSNGLSADAAKKHYLLHANNVGLLKRALAGFHPRLFMDLSPNFDRAARLDPLTQYLQAGKPPGPWQHPVLRLQAGATAWPPESKTALHGHFFYTDHVPDFLHALAANRSRVDLLLTTGSEAQRVDLAEATAGYRQGSVKIEIVPNRGRDIGPFLHVFRQVHSEYEIIGHLHGKRSLHTLEQDAQLGDRWRNFLFQHLLGADAAAMDVILAAFAADPQLGIVFPEDPHVIGWDRDLPLAQRLAAQMGFRQELPPHLDFPVGTMFWARTAALKPLLKLNLEWADYPPEPLPIDGTILHALERLLPSVAREAGYGFATTYFPGVAR